MKTKTIIEYNYNISFDPTTRNSRVISGLESNEYYVLMVKDSKKYNDTRDFFNAEMEWLGLEQTSEGKIYISKKFNNRQFGIHGDTFLAKVNNPTLCLELNN